MNQRISALEYHNSGYHVIPVRHDKKPYIKWQRYQHEKPLIDEIDEWFTKWPDANIGIVTGRASNLTVIDIDTNEAGHALKKYMPLIKPFTKTPHGWHFWFLFHDNLPNASNILPGMDIRTEGGYVIAPPGRNENGGIYKRREGNVYTEIPDALYNKLKSINSYNNTTVLGYSNKNNVSTQCSNYTIDDNNRQHRQQTTTLGLKKGSRDNTLFHLANYLVKSGMPESNILFYLEMFAKFCDPPFPEKEINLKLQSAITRARRIPTSLTSEIRELIATSSGNFTTTFVHMRQHLTTREEKKKANAIILRMEKEGLIEKTGRLMGEYRIVDQAAKPENWIEASSETAKLWLPLGLSHLTGQDGVVNVSPGDIVLFAGTPNVGKTGFLMNIARENRLNWKVHYISSELRAGKFKSRFANDPTVSLDMLKDINFYDLTKSRLKSFEDNVKPGEGNLNIFDYIESTEEVYKIGGYIDGIFSKLDGAIAIVAIQKKPGADSGYGGTFTIMRPVLAVNLDRIKDENVNKATIIKCKEPDSDFIKRVGNPDYMSCKFNLVDGIKIIKKTNWQR